MRLNGTVTTLAYGGKGILRTPDQFVVFVPFTAPGDLIECKLTKVKKNYAEADLLQVITPGKERITPLCPYFGTCGGCQLQHLAYDAQTEYKRLNVEEALRRVYPDIAVSISKATQEWGYRTHITMTMKPEPAGYKVGYFTVDNKTLIEAKECPIFCSKEDPILATLNAMSHELIPADRFEAKVKVLKDSNQKFVFNFHFKKLPSNFAALAKKYLSDHLVGICGNSIKETVTHGKIKTSLTVDGKKFVTHPDAFLQAHSELSALIYGEIRDFFQKSPVNLLIDLYSGVGITSVLAAPFAKEVVGVEFNKKAIELAKMNARFQNIGNASFKEMKVEDEIVSLLERNPEAAILNPPREGLNSFVTKYLAESKLQKILYLSCQPATLARDLAVFKENGFKLDKAQAFDMFPQTGHVETLVTLNRTAP